MTFITYFYLDENMEWTDIDGGRSGEVHKSPRNILISGWTLYFVSIILNLLFYKLHPSSPEISLTWPALKEKLQNSCKEMFNDTDADTSGEKEFELIPLVDRDFPDGTIVSVSLINDIVDNL